MLFMTVIASSMLLIWGHLFQYLAKIILNFGSPYETVI